LSTYEIVFVDGNISEFSCTDHSIQIGRSAECEIILEDYLCSKIQCSIRFTQLEGWRIQDGEEGSYSTNGTWIYQDRELLLRPNMIFKIKQNIFEVKEISKHEKDFE